MKSAITCFSLLLSFAAKAQLAIINDSDSYVNVHKKADVHSRIIGRLHSDEIFDFEDADSTSQLAFINYSPDHYGKIYDTAYIEGYVYRNRITPIETLKHIALSHEYRHLSDSSLAIRKDSVKMEILTTPFNEKDHKIRRDKARFVMKIDGRKAYGIDGELPKMEIKVFELTINGYWILIAPEYYNDLYEPGIGSFNVYFGKKGDIYLYMPDNSDGAGGYAVAWLIRNRKFVKRYVDTSEE